MSAEQLTRLLDRDPVYQANAKACLRRHLQGKLDHHEFMRARNTLRDRALLRYHQQERRAQYRKQNMNQLGAAFDRGIYA
jgi:hypothetical protein